MHGPTTRRPIQLTDQHTLHDTMTVLRQHVPLTAAGYRCQTDDLWRLLARPAIPPLRPSAPIWWTPRMPTPCAGI